MDRPVFEKSAPASGVSVLTRESCHKPTLRNCFNYGHHNGWTCGRGCNTTAIELLAFSPAALDDTDNCTRHVVRSLDLSCIRNSGRSSRPLPRLCSTSQVASRGIGGTQSLFPCGILLGKREHSRLRKVLAAFTIFCRIVLKFPQQRRDGFRSAAKA